MIAIALGDLTLVETHSAGSRVLEIEKYLPKAIDKSCTVVIFWETVTEFRPIIGRPVLLLTKEYEELQLSDYCNVLIFPNFTAIKGSLEEFLFENRVNTAAVLVYTSLENPTTIKQVRTYYVRKLDVVMIDLDQGTSKLYKYPIDCQGSLKCEMRRRSLRMGYTSVSMKSL
jgi:hypothetical protein